MTLKSGFGVVQGHLKWRASTDHVWLSISPPLYYSSILYHMIDCVDLNDVRNKHFVASSVKDVFNVEAQKIVDFIKEIWFYEQL